jgi:hypothetical protein
MLKGEGAIGMHITWFTYKLSGVTPGFASRSACKETLNVLEITARVSPL